LIEACAELHPFSKLIVVPFILINAFGLAFKLVENKPSKFVLILVEVITTEVLFEAELLTIELVFEIEYFV
jgi:hypothetical protein